LAQAKGNRILSQPFLACMEHREPEDLPLKLTTSDGLIAALAPKPQSSKCQLRSP
jgi:hypothetical protein